MSNLALAWAWEQDPGSTTTKLVLIALADTANDDGELWPSQRYLGHKVGLRERQVREHLSRLEERGFIERMERRRQDGTRSTDLFRLTTPPPVYPIPPEGTDDQPAESRRLADDQPAESRRDNRQSSAGPEPSGEPSVEPRHSSGDGSLASPPSSPPVRDDPHDESDMKLQAPEPEVLFDVPTTKDADIAEVWAYYVEVNDPIQKDLSPARERMLERALREISVEEAKLAIDGNRASEWHRARGAHALGDIFKPNRQRGENIRTRVDRFIRDAQRAGKTGGLPSVDRGTLDMHKENVRQGVAPGASDFAKRRGDESKAWLEANGWTVTVRDGWAQFAEKAA